MGQTERHSVTKGTKFPIYRLETSVRDGIRLGLSMRGAGRAGGGLREEEHEGRESESGIADDELHSLVYRKESALRCM